MKLKILVIFLLSCSVVINARSQGKEANNPENTWIVYLSGTGPEYPVEWDFFCTSGRNSGFWTKIKVPSCWEQEGFGGYLYGVNFYNVKEGLGIPTEQGLYKTEFEVPAGWQGRRVFLVFGGVMTDTRVLVNGQKAGSLHQGGFCQFKYDVSGLLRFGEKNLLEVTVSKESENMNVNMAERRADYWDFGGIFRPVYLESKPAQFIRRVAIDAKADGIFRAEVFTGEGNSGSYSVAAQIFDSNNNPVGSPFEKEVAPGSDKVILQAQPDNIRQWTAETPVLYHVGLVLKKDGKPVHSVSEKFGFRTFEVRGKDGFYLNGQRILLKGVNRHSFCPETGRTLSKEQNYDDVRLIKEMNMNAVRMSHYPPDPEFLDACDELGLYVLDELPGWQRKHDTPTGRKLIEELVVRDVNHPCIVFWDNGNEGGWNTELDNDFACWDPQNRAVLHPQQLLNGVQTMHYRSYGETQEYLRQGNIFFPTEMLHGLYDGGHGAGLYDYWEMMRNHPLCGGAMLWDFADEGIVRTDQGGRIDTDGNHGADGILGPHHEKEGSFYAIKEIWSPVVVLNKTIGRNFDGRFEIGNRYDFTNLSDCHFEWQLAQFVPPGENETGHNVLKSGKTAGPSVAPHSSGILQISLPGNREDADVLYLKAFNPEGQEILTWSWNLAEKVAIYGTQKNQDVKILEEEDFSVVETGKMRLYFNRQTGGLSKVSEEGKYLNFGNGPRFVAARRADRHFDGWVDTEAPKGVDRFYNDISGESKPAGFKAFVENGTAIVEADYSGNLKKARWTISPDGQIKLEYRYRYDGVVELMGIQFDYPEEKMVSKTWLGGGPYRVWQNRLQGTVLNVWENEYNDPVPAESFVYPEFKGFFGNWHWAKFKTLEGSFTIGTEGYGSYLGVYSPRDGRDALLYTFPKTGISILDVIPAVRNKVNTTDLVGPSSQAQHVSGEKSGTLYFKFELN